MKKAAKNAKKEDTVIQLPGNLSIYEVGEIREEFLAGLVAGKSLTIDLQKVEEWDVAGLQLLVAAQKTALNAGIPLRIDNPPEQLCAALPLLGFSPDFLAQK